MKLFWGLVIMTLGVLILGVSLGWWSNDVWIAFLSFWPLILIVLGLQMITKNKNMSSLIVLIFVLGAVFLSFQTKADWLPNWQWLNVREDGQSITTSKVVEKYDKGKEKDMDLTINVGATKVSINSLSESDNNTLFEATALNLGQLEESRAIDGSTARIKLSQKESGVFLFTPSSWKNRELSVSITPNIPTRLGVDSGASSLDIDLSKLQISNLKIKAGASSGEIRFGSLVDKVESSIDMGASSIRLQIPKEIGFKILTDSGLTRVSFVGNVNITKNDEGYVSADYETSKKTILINLSSGASSVEIGRY
jgi:hypothetical protein